MNQHLNVESKFKKLIVLMLLLFTHSSFSYETQLIQVGEVAVDTQATPDEIIIYEKIAERELSLHVFYAKNISKRASNEKGKAPALILFHGGGWNSGTPKQFYDQANYFAQLGVTVFSVEYRLWGVDKTPPNVSVMDAKSAYRWVVANANRLGIDSTNIAAGGASAGGHLAASLAALPGFNGRGQVINERLSIKALILFNPVVDMSEEGFGYHLVSEYWHAISPLHNIVKGHPPAILFLGTDDHVLSVETANKYRDKVREVGAKSELVIYPNKKHGFFNRTRSEEAFIDTVLESHKFLYRAKFIAQPPIYIADKL